MVFSLMNRRMNKTQLNFHSLNDHSLKNEERNRRLFTDDLTSTIHQLRYTGGLFPDNYEAIHFV